MGQEKENQSRLGRYVRAPIRALRGVRDLYVRSLTGFAGRHESVVVAGYPGAMLHSYSLPPRRTAGGGGGGGDDLKELIWAASEDKLARRMAAAMATKSQSVAIGRIDEDAPCEFSGDLQAGSDLLLPRSQSVAVDGIQPKRRPRVST